MIVAGFSAYSRAIDWKRFAEIAKSVGALLFVDMAHVAGLIAMGLYPDPIQHADVVTTTTHKTLRGPRGGLILARANDEITKKLNSTVFPGTQGGPLMHVIAAKAVAFQEALQPDFKEYQQQVLASALVTVNGLDTPVGPGSTIAAVAIVNCIKVRTAQLLVERSAMPPVITRASVVGADRSRELFDEAYREHARRVTRAIGGEVR